jgi:hypothetical protein
MRPAPLAAPAPAAAPAVELVLYPECAALEAGADILLGVIGTRRYCVHRWLDAGRPFPRNLPTLQAVHEAELRTRERMLARGGGDANRVRKGKS